MMMMLTMKDRSSSSSTRFWSGKFSFFILSLLLLTDLPVVRSLRCVNCKGCSKFEDSQAVTCPSSLDKCLKLHLPSGLINRECGDEKTCQEKRTDGRHITVHCCSENMCNDSAFVFRRRPIETATFLVLLMTSLCHHFFFFY